MDTNVAPPILVFFSYAHEDEQLRDELAKHLSILRRQGVIADWHDRKITAGDEWSGEIDRYLDSAQIILLLISASFLASDYCYDVELTRAMERHAAGEARVIPIILRPVEWRGAPFGKLQALPRDAKPVTRWADRDEAFVDVARGIRAVAERLRGRPAASPFAPELPDALFPITRRQASERGDSTLQADLERLVQVSREITEPEVIVETPPRVAEATKSNLLDQATRYDPKLAID